MVTCRKRLDESEAFCGSRQWAEKCEWSLWLGIEIPKWFTMDGGDPLIENGSEESLEQESDELIQDVEHDHEELRVPEDQVP